MSDVDDLLRNQPHRYRLRRMKSALMAPPLHLRVIPTIRAEMARRGMRQKDVARLLRVSQAGISERMNGHTPFALDEVQALAERFGMPVSALLADAETVSIDLLPRMDSNHQPSGYAEQQFGVRTCYRSTPTARIRWAVRTGTQHTSRCPQTGSRGPRVVRVGGILP